MANKKHLARLRQGVKAWNKWRETNREIKPDLSDAWLIRADLRGANLYRADLRKADLRDADFSDAWLISADLRKANLSDANLSEANLSDANLSDANLSDAWLISADLREADLRGADLSKAHLRGADLSKAHLRGADLRGADLSDADLRGANLREADLRGADLRGADLKATQALATNFQDATLTGACIQYWNINSETNLKDVICDYVYLKEDKQERRPSDPKKNFAPGEFTKLFQKTLETVDLIFREGIDWKATAYSLNNTQVLNENTPLAIQSIENKGDGVVLIRVSVPKYADKHKIESDFWQGYEFAQKALETQYRARIEDKNQEINRLFLLLNQAQENSGEALKSMSEQPKYDQREAKISIGSYVDTAQSGSRQEGQAIQHNYAPEQKQTLAEAAAEIQKLLKQLEERNPTATVEQQQAFVDVAVSPTLKAKFVSALQAGWKEAVKEFLDNPYVNVGVAILEGWQEAE